LSEREREINIPMMAQTILLIERYPSLLQPKGRAKSHRDSKIELTEKKKQLSDSLH
jgi:hypothetical protein